MGRSCEPAPGGGDTSGGLFLVGGVIPHLNSEHEAENRNQQGGIPAPAHAVDATAKGHNRIQEQHHSQRRVEERGTNAHNLNS